MDQSTPRPPTARRFTLLDGMIVIVAVAFWLGQRRIWWFSDEPYWAYLPHYLFTTSLLPKIRVYGFLSTVLLLSTSIVLWSTAATLVLRLRRPRPRWRRLAIQPGLAATSATALAMATGLIFTQALYAIRSPFQRAGQLTAPEDGMVLTTFTYAWSPLAGFGVLVAWALLILSGRWRAEPTWVDRLGRAIGVVSIAMGLVAGFVLIEIFI